MPQFRAFLTKHYSWTFLWTFAWSFTWSLNCVSAILRVAPISTMMGDERRWTVICLLLRGVRTKICSFQRFVNNVFRSTCYWWCLFFCAASVRVRVQCVRFVYIYIEKTPPRPSFFFFFFLLLLFLWVRTWEKRKSVHLTTAQHLDCRRYVSTWP